MQILWLLSRSSNYGYELMKKLSKIKNKKITQGTIYPTLNKLEKRGVIQSKFLGNKKIYELTKKGKIVSKQICLEFTNTFEGIFKDFVCSKCKVKNNVKN